MDKWLESCLPALLKPLHGERVLDIGCGDGGHLLLLQKLGLDLWGIDASSYMIHRARERLGHRCALRTARAEDLPFEDNSFDLAVMINTLEFLDDPLPALREAGRVARRAVFVGAMNSISWQGLSRGVMNFFNQNPLSRARFFTLWGLKLCMRNALGDVPLVWKSSQGVPRIMERACRAIPWVSPGPSLPFGAHIGLAATVVYRVKTNNLGLKIRVRSQRGSVPEGVAMGKYRGVGGVSRREGSLSV